MGHGRSLGMQEGGSARGQVLEQAQFLICPGAFTFAFWDCGRARVGMDRVVKVVREKMVLGFIFEARGDIMG